MTTEDIQALCKELHQVLSQADKMERNYEAAMHRVSQLENDIDRLVNFSAVQGLDLRDSSDCPDNSTEYWRYLPDHLQAAINSKAEELDTKEPING